METNHTSAYHCLNRGVCCLWRVRRFVDVGSYQQGGCQRNRRQKRGRRQDGANRVSAWLQQLSKGCFLRFCGWACFEWLAGGNHHGQFCAPSDLSKYSLLTLAYPVYGGTVGTAIVSYVNRVNNFAGVNTVIIACGGGDSGESIIPLKQQVEAANGTFYDSLALSNGNSTALESAQQAGSSITP
jgi:hypothetical protein